MNQGRQCKSGIITYDDVVQNPEILIRKKHSRDASKLPDESKMLVHAAESLRKSEYARLKSNDAVGGNFWFGSVGSYIELHLRLNVNSTLIVKNNTTFSQCKHFTEY